MIKLKQILATIKIIRTKQLQNILSSIFGEHTTHGVSKSKNQRCRVCSIIMEEKSYTFENPNTTFMMNKNLNCIPINVVYIIKYCNGKKVYIGSTSALNNKVSLHRRNI